MIGIEPRGGRGRESDLGSERYENTVRKNGNSGRATSEFAASPFLTLEAPLVATGPRRAGGIAYVSAKTAGCRLFR